MRALTTEMPTRATSDQCRISLDCPVNPVNRVDRANRVDPVNPVDPAFLRGGGGCHRLRRRENLGPRAWRADDVVLFHQERAVHPENRAGPVPHRQVFQDVPKLHKILNIQTFACKLWSN